MAFARLCVLPAHLFYAMMNAMPTVKPFRVARADVQIVATVRTRLEDLVELCASSVTRTDNMKVLLYLNQVESACLSVIR